VCVFVCVCVRVCPVKHAVLIYMRCWQYVYICLHTRTHTVFTCMCVASPREPNNSIYIYTRLRTRTYIQPNISTYMHVQLKARPNPLVLQQLMGPVLVLKDHALVRRAPAISGSARTCSGHSEEVRMYMCICT